MKIGKIRFPRVFCVKDARLMPGVYDIASRFVFLSFFSSFFSTKAVDPAERVDSYYSTINRTGEVARSARCSVIRGRERKQFPY